MARQWHNSLLAGALATKILDGQSHTLGCVTMHLRYCTRKGERSGGIELEAYGQALPHEIGTRYERRKYLYKPSGKALYRQAAHLAETLRQELANPLRKLREQVYQLAESKELDLDLVERQGKEMEYTKLTEADCQYWLEWLRQQPNKQQQAEGRQHE